jgi:hypothetical protein
VCKTEKERSNFSKDRTQKDGLDGKCVACSAVYTETHRAEAHIWYLRDYKNNIEKYFARSAERRSAKLNATPPWFERAEVEGVYKSAITRSKSESIKYHVDHIVPLQSKFVCGLHCLANLQIIPGEDNISKGNRYWPDMWEITDDHYWLLDAQKDV